MAHSPRTCQPMNMPGPPLSHTTSFCFLCSPSDCCTCRCFASQKKRLPSVSSDHVMGISPAYVSSAVKAEEIIHER